MMFCWVRGCFKATHYYRFEKTRHFEQFYFHFITIFSMNVYKNEPPAKTKSVRKKFVIYFLLNKHPSCRRSRKNLLYENTWLWGRSKAKRQIEKPEYLVYFFKQFQFLISKWGYISPLHRKFALKCKSGAYQRCQDGLLCSGVHSVRKL